MRQSSLFTRVSKETPKDEVSFNAQTLIRAGFIDKTAAGIYTYLPLGLRVLNKIIKIVREEMDSIGGQEVLMPALLPKELWTATGRWDVIDVLFKLRGSDEKEYALGATHEEMVTPTVRKHVFSYKDLPTQVYQVQTKFRNELRAKSGLIRGREFIMKDLYSFHRDDADLNEFYKLAQKAYFKVYERVGLLDQTYLTFASGGAFSRYSHEFQTVTSAGEDKIYICDSCNIAINDEIIEEQKVCPNCQSDKFRTENAVEVGNIFKLGNKFSSAFDFKYTDENGEKKDVVMGCYGIGPSRVMGTVVEVCHDDRGIVWPSEIAPFKVHLVYLNSKDETIKAKAEELYKKLQINNFEVLYDDRDLSAGEKFAESDLIGCPYRLVVSEKSLKEGNVELKRRSEEKAELVKLDKVVEFIK